MRTIRAREEQRMTRRDAALAEWIGEQGLAQAAIAPGGGDASARRYWRVSTPSRSLMVMDAPEQAEDCAAFVRIQSLMQAAGLRVPEILAADTQAGFMLLEDLGTQDYLAALQRGEHGELIPAALTALVRWQAATRDNVLASFDAPRLAAELALFPTWYVERHLGVSPDAAWWQAWQQGTQGLIDAAVTQPQVWVHRDFMARNLLVTRPGPAVIDFQDALCGPVTYDLASLLRDAFFSLSPAEETRYIQMWLDLAAAADVPLPSQPDKAIDLMAAQRHLKVLGIFARLRYRDQKPHYLEDAPRFLGYLSRELAPYAEFALLRDCIAELPMEPAR